MLPVTTIIFYTENVCTYTYVNMHIIILLYNKSYVHFESSCLQVAVFKHLCMYVLNYLIFMLKAELYNLQTTVHSEIRNYLYILQISKIAAKYWTYIYKHKLCRCYIIYYIAIESYKLKVITCLQSDRKAWSHSHILYTYVPLMLLP